MQKAGMTPMQVLVAATRGGARALGRETELGHARGRARPADLLVLAADPTRDVAPCATSRRWSRGGEPRTWRSCARRDPLRRHRYSWSHGFPRPSTRTYSNGEVTVIWKPHLCIHSGICFAGLP